MVAEVVAAAGVSFAEIARIAVTVGPGSFTGLRVGVAFAKGLRLATGAALAALEVLPALAEDAGHDCVAAAVDARQGRVHVQVFEAGSPLGPPATLSIDEAAAWLGAQGCQALTGPGAPLLAPHLTAARLVLAPFPSIGALAALARRAPDAADVRPLYLRAPDIRTKGA